jgi:peroxiredoxin
MAVTKGRRSKASQTATLKVGDQAPDFELPSHGGAKVKLSDLRGKNVVLAFYPLAWTAV